MNDFIFASSSPRRIEIVKKLDLNITFVNHEYEENNNLSKSPDELVIYNAIQKAKVFHLNIKINIFLLLIHWFFSE